MRQDMALFLSLIIEFTIKEEMNDINLNITSLYLCCPCFSTVLLCYWSYNETQTNQSERNNSIFNEGLYMWSRNHVIKWELFYGKQTCHRILLGESGRYNQTTLMSLSSLSVALALDTHTHLLQDCMKMIHNNLISWDEAFKHLMLSIPYNSQPIQP